MTYQVITGTLKARTAIHVGSGAGGDLTDAPIRRNAGGQPIIPGTAIAGALRTLATRLAPRLGSKVCAALKDPDDRDSRASCDCAVCHLFGDINPSDDEDANSEASRLLVFNARLKDDAPKTLIRDGVGIDRVTGTAARAGGVKFDLEVLPAGTEFELRLELRDKNEKDRQLLAAVLAEWQAGRAWLGGNVARGLGAFELSDDVAYKIFALDTADNLLTFLKQDEPWRTAQSRDDWLEKQLDEIEIVSPRKIEQEGETRDILSYIARRWVTIEGTLQAEGPLLTNDVTTSGQTGFDHAPLLAQLGNWRQPMLAGSGLRGVLRAHAERIARTLATRNANGEEAFLQTCPACSPVESRADEALASCDALLRGKVSTNDEVSDEHLCLACRLFGSTRRGSRLLVEDAPYDSAEDKPPRLKMLDFLAIDRFTGGGAEEAKFDALALWKPAFKLRLHLDNPAPWELGWLALVLRDLQEGWLSVGFGAAKGFGRVKLKHPQFTLGYLSPDDIKDLGLAADGGQKKTVYTEMPISLDQAQPWVDQFLKAVDQFQRGNNGLPELRVDSYFSQEPDLTVLYPSEVTL
jgi:CRISPR/Cas system CSM-associated protein Csm3 (group 7 of RAMP superfamily)